MNGTDIASIRRAFRVNDVLLALALLTRLPMPHHPSAGRAPSAAAWAYPLVGLIVGLLAYGVGWVLETLGTAAPITAAFVLLAGIVITGAMHEDGLADCADGFWGGWTVAKRLEIMKDSQIGTYGVSALGMSLILRWYLLTMLIDKGALLAAVLVAAVVSRAAMVWVMYSLPNARREGLSAQTGRPAGLPTIAALAMALIAAIAAPSVFFLWLLLFVGVVTLGAGMLARRKIGGQTGDVLGATQQLAEITVLICIDVAISNWG